MAGLKIVSDRLDDNSIALRVVLEPRRNGEVNFAALEAINRALYVINPTAYDAGEPPAPVIAHREGHTADGGGVVPHAIAEAMLRDLQDDDEGAPGEPPRCKTGGCE